MTYKASLDKLAKWTTLLVFVILIVVGCRSIIELITTILTVKEIIVHSLILLLFFLMLLLSWLFAPTAYSISENNLIIHRKISDVSIHLASITTIQQLTSQQIKGTIRTFGVGGLFGYFGKFHVPKIGSCTVYATQRKNIILIETLKKKYVITPDNIQFADELINKWNNNQSIH